jgi:hypothetical protein
VVDSTFPAPDPATDAQAHLDWSQCDQEAHLQLILTLSPALHDHVLDTTSSKEVWDMLKARYQGSGELRSHYLLERLFTTPFINSEPMEPQINNIVSIARQLNAINFPISDQWLTGMLRVKLPPSWNTLKTVLANVKDKKLMSKGVIAQILAEKHRCIREDGRDAKAYYAKSLGKGKGKPKCRKEKECSHCDRKGHNVSECYKLKREKEEKEKVSKANSRSGTPSSSKSLNKSSSGKSSLSKSTSAKIAEVNTDSSESDSDDTVQVYMARTTSTPHALEPTIEHVYKTKAKLSRSNLQNSWLIDSGALCTMCLHRSWFTSFSPLSNHTKVVLSDDSSIPAIGTGRVCIRMHAGGKWIMSILQDVLYVPELSTNLLSVSHLACHSAEVHFVGETCRVYDKAKMLILEGQLCNDLYIMWMHVDGPVTARVATTVLHPENGTEPPARALTMRLMSSTGSLDLCHRHLGHLYTKAITRMIDKNLMTGMEISNRELTTQPCKPCLKGKQTHEEIHKVTSTRSEHVLGRIFSDVCSPLPTQSHRGYKYFITFTDNKSRWVSISPLKEKSEVGQHLKAFITRAELEMGLKVKALHSDGGGEYMARHVQQFLEDYGIRHEMTMADMP